MYSTLFTLPATIEHGGVVVGTLLDGSVVVHGAPGVEIPAEAAAVHHDGTTMWYWRDLALEHPDLVPHVAPQEYSGEPTGEGIDVALFPRLVPPLLEAE